MSKTKAKKSEIAFLRGVPHKYRKHETALVRAAWNIKDEIKELTNHLRRIINEDMTKREANCYVYGNGRFADTDEEG